MVNFNKIDPRIWDVVKTSSLNCKQKCLIWFNGQLPKGLLNENEKIHNYPFIKAVGANLIYGKILKLSECNCVNYISSVQKASIYLTKVQKQIDLTSVSKAGFLGKGINVAVIDTGCHSHLDLVLGHNRIVKFVDFVNDEEKNYDDNGHGTFVCGAIAGNGLTSGGIIHGVAPKCNLIVLKALNSDGETQIFTILDAMQWVIDNKERFNIKVVCMSFGSEPMAENDPLKLGAEVLWDEGIVVVCASGNDGENVFGVKSPAISSKVISVGACEQNGQFEMAKFSSYGVYDGVIRPDLVAPGVNVVSAGVSAAYVSMSGTSVSTPLVAGASCLILEKQNLKPNEVKNILLKTAEKHNLPKEKCGSGVLNVSKALDYLELISAK